MFVYSFIQKCCVFQRPWGHIHEDDENGLPPDVQILRAVAAGSRLLIPAQARISMHESLQFQPRGSAGWCDLMAQCWDQDPQDRPNFKTVFEMLGEMCRQQDLAVAQSKQASTHTLVECGRHADSSDIELELYHLLE